MSTYTYDLPRFAAEADQAERAARSLDSTQGVSIDEAAETITVTSPLTHGEVLDVLRRHGISAQ
ncbi:hypothetical protein D7D52_23490 [Nocardia yunnanensis]|uniref:Uncharacterized protein n=1 Tax=Nocardia yunnanensis TaxID=2382165 RepID=A0A386ZIB6_9NOCA|nr:hypothetical protein [Nocardia yunnanensis]AYF76299.1 hypothetical protein D7D52_23490 [Nocardia yunnanensis]